MKLFVVIYCTLTALTLGPMAFAETHQKGVEFEYKAADMNLKTYGANIHKAREKASEECFNRRIDEFDNQRGQLPGEDQALAIIDSCVNI